MLLRLKSILAHVSTLALICAGLYLVLNRPETITVTLQQQVATTSVQTAAAIVTATSSQPKKTAPVSTATKQIVKAPKQASTTPVVEQTPPDQVSRVQNPYPFAPLPADEVNLQTRSALVNILCMPRGGSLSPISGSGVLIDSRGVILTNAHVAQYVLLAQDPRVNLSCVVRTGAPAAARWSAAVLYIPPVWVDAHAKDIRNPRPTGTGEHDYALLYVSNSVDGSPLPATFPSLSYDTREAIAFQGDQVLVAGYPAEFLGGIVAEYNLFPASSVTAIGQLVTFGASKSVDLLSLGGVIEAQSGSSGGAVVNGWGRLVGIISTTSDGPTTADRDLRSLTLSYISRDLAAQSGLGLGAFLEGDLLAKAQDFAAHRAPTLSNLYLPFLRK